MRAESLAGLAIDDLVARALATNDDDDQYWAVVHELHRRGNDSTFEAAASLCSQTTEASQCLGLHILAQLGYQHGRPYLEQSLPLVVRLSGVGQAPGVLPCALGALGHLQDDRGLGAILEHARHSDAHVRLAVAQSIPGVAGELPGPEVVAVVLELMRDPEPQVRLCHHRVRGSSPRVLSVSSKRSGRRIRHIFGVATCGT